jgi:hypothetical protein
LKEKFMIKLMLVLVPFLTMVGCQNRPSTSPYILATYDKSGGFVGFDQRFVVRSDGQLILDDRRTKQRTEAMVPEHELERLRGLVESAEFRETQRQYTAEGSDLITYTIEAATPTRTHTVSTMDAAAAKPPQIVSDVIEELERLIALAREASAPGKGR